MRQQTQLLPADVERDQDNKLSSRPSVVVVLTVCDDDPANRERVGEMKPSFLAREILVFRHNLDFVVGWQALPRQNDAGKLHRRPNQSNGIPPPLLSESVAAPAHPASCGGPGAARTASSLVLGRDSLPACRRVVFLRASSLGHGRSAAPLLFLVVVVPVPMPTAHRGSTAALPPGTPAIVRVGHTAMQARAEPQPAAYPPGALLTQSHSSTVLRVN